MAGTFNVAAVIFNYSLLMPAQKGAVMEHILGSEQVVPLLLDPLLQNTKIWHPLWPTHGMVEGVPCHKVKGVEVGGVWRLVLLAKLCSPDLTHEPWHCYLCCIGCVCWGTVHDKEAVLSDVSSQPTKELPHCSGECPSWDCLMSLVDMAPGSPVWHKDPQNHEAFIAAVCIDAGIPGITCDSLDYVILCTVQVQIQFKVHLIHKDLSSESVSELLQEASCLLQPLVLVPSSEFLTSLTCTWLQVQLLNDPPTYGDILVMIQSSSKSNVPTCPPWDAWLPAEVCDSWNGVSGNFFCYHVACMHPLCWARATWL